jgi:hypothetical protein
MSWIVLILLGAFLWRLRGGLLNDLTGVANWHGANDTVVRLFWSIGMAAAYSIFAPISWHDLALVVGLFAGTTIVGWFGALAADTPQRIAMMSLSGILRMAFVAAALFSPWPLIAGIVCGPVYWISYKIPRPAAGWVWPEIMFGGVIGASLAAAITWPLFK